MEVVSWGRVRYLICSYVDGDGGGEEEVVGGKGSVGWEEMSLKLGSLFAGTRVYPGLRHLYSCGSFSRSSSTL